jgi:hypothetical protein
MGREERKGRQNIGGIADNPTAQRFRSTLDYMDIGPYSLPERSTMNVEISLQLGGLYENFAA